MRPDWRDYPCIEWTGARHNAGYGKLSDGRLAHRVAFEEHYGYLPQEPHVVDHECRNRLCVQPFHLQEITRAENTRLGWARRPKAEKCKRGHNQWRVHPDGKRRCQPCRIANAIERNRRVRAAKRQAIVA